MRLCSANSQMNDPMVRSLYLHTCSSISVFQSVACRLFAQRAPLNLAPRIVDPFGQARLFEALAAESEFNPSPRLAPSSSCSHHFTTSIVFGVSFSQFLCRISVADLIDACFSLQSQVLFSGNRLDFCGAQVTSGALKHP